MGIQKKPNFLILVLLKITTKIKLTLNYGKKKKVSRVKISDFGGLIFASRRFRYRKIKRRKKSSRAILHFHHRGIAWSYCARVSELNSACSKLFCHRSFWSLLRELCKHAYYATTASSVMRSSIIIIIVAVVVIF